MKVDGVGVFGGELRDLGVGRVLQRLRPLVPVAAVLLGQRAPDGEVVQAAALAGAVGGVRHLPARRPVHPVDPCQRGALGLPRGVAIDQLHLVCAGLHLGPRLADGAAVADIGEFGYRLDPQIQRIDEPARGRQVR